MIAINIITNFLGFNNFSYYNSTSYGYYPGFFSFFVSLINMLAGIMLLFMIISLAVAVLFIVACWQIVTKAGYPGWWAILFVLINIIPFVGSLVSIVLFFIFAFADWPILKRFKTAYQPVNPNTPQTIQTDQTSYNYANRQTPPNSQASTSTNPNLSPNTSMDSSSSIKFCPKCNYNVEFIDTFCSNCGQPLK